MLRTTRALLLSTHPAPAVAVTAIAVVLGIAVGLEPWRVVVLGLAMALDQASVGLSNDWLDADRDRAVGRTDKPVARGDVPPAVARTAAFSAAALAIALTLPLGWAATVVHLLFLASAWAYNAGLKATPVSVLPYVVSFGVLPLLATAALPEPAWAAWWALAAGALLGVAAHFANVLPDLGDDAATGIRGMPHRFGARATGVVIAAALAGAAAAIVLGPGGPGPVALAGLIAGVVLAAVCAVLVVRAALPRLVFPLILAAALLDVVLLATSGRRLVA
jgi:4-hydroxybenzoate polyprenyltransferase